MQVDHRLKQDKTGKLTEWLPNITAPVLPRDGGFICNDSLLSGDALPHAVKAASAAGDFDDGWIYRDSISPALVSGRRGAQLTRTLLVHLSERAVRCGRPFYKLKQKHVSRPNCPCPRS